MYWFGRIGQKVWIHNEGAPDRAASNLEFKVFDKGQN